MRILKIISIFVFLLGLVLIILGAFYNPSSINDMLSKGEIKDYEFNMEKNESITLYVTGTNYFTLYIMNDTSFKHASNFSSSLYTDTAKSMRFKFTAPQTGKYHLIIANVNSEETIGISINYGKQNIWYLIPIGIIICSIAIILPIYDHLSSLKKIEIKNSVCPECGRPVSSLWNYCPYCRHPLKDDNNILKFISVIILLLLVIPSAHVVKANPMQVKETILKWSFENKTYSLEIVVKDVPQPKIFLDGYALSLTVPEDEYEFYHVYPGGYRFSLDASYLKYFLTTQDNATRLLAMELNKISQNMNYDPLTELNFILAFIHSLKYDDDFKTTGFIDYYKFPLETLVDGSGDCEDLSILLATIAHIIGYDVILFVMNVTTVLTDEKMGHVAVGVNIERSGPYSEYLRDYYIYDGRRYYYMETTASESRKLMDGTIHYYVGISPEETDYYQIENVKFVPFSSYVYHGYANNSKYVEKISSHPPSNSLLYSITAVILTVIYLPVILLTSFKERKRCPACGHEIEDDYNYCPYCGYMLQLPPPSFSDFQSDISSTDEI